MTESLRATFGRAPELYARVRPGYPAELFDDLVALSSIPARGRVLEIGPGTGQATIPMAKRGYTIIGVELSDGLAAVGNQLLLPYPNASIEVTSFEDWPLLERRFDLVMAATAFHWLDPRTAYRKSARALVAGGSLAIVMSHHVAGGTREFFAAVQDCYERFMPGTEPGITLDDPDSIPPDTQGIFNSGLFEAPEFRRYVWTETYTTDAYIDLLSTYSGHIDLAPENQTALFDCIRGLIDGKHGGSIVKAYMTELVVARKLA